MTKHKLESLAVKVTNKQLGVWTEINKLLTYVLGEKANLVEALDWKSKGVGA